MHNMMIIALFYEGLCSCSSLLILSVKATFATLKPTLIVSINGGEAESPSSAPLRLEVGVYVIHVIECHTCYRI